MSITYIVIRDELDKLKDVIMNIPLNKKVFNTNNTFPKLLSEFLKKITYNCNNYIDYTFLLERSTSDITCLYTTSISTLYNEIKDTVIESDNDKEVFLDKLFTLLEKIPSKYYLQYKKYITVYKDEYRKELLLKQTIIKQTQQTQHLEEQKRLLTLQEVKKSLELPKSYISLKADFHNKNIEKYAHTFGKYDLDLMFDINFDFAKKIVERHELVTGKRVINTYKGHYTSPKQETEYDDFDYFLILRNVNIDDQRRVANYEEYLKIKLALEYLKSQKPIIIGNYEKYKIIKVDNFKDLNDNEYLLSAKKHQIIYKDLNDLIPKYETKLTEYKSVPSLRDLYDTEKEKMRTQLISSNIMTVEMLKDKTLYDLYHISKQTQPVLGGGNPKIKKLSKKTILGKERCIYAIQGDRKEYLRYKGNLIPVKDYKKVMSNK